MAAGWRVDMLIPFGPGQSLCFGEVLLRLATPGSLLLTQSPALDMVVGGAEANVAAGLATLGRSVRMASRLPDNALGRLARGTLMGHGVNCDALTLSPVGRMGLYFLETGAGARASNIIYDRKHSSFAEARPADFDWDALLDGVSHLHMSGITPALGDTPAQVAIAAGTAARAKGILVSFDGNYRTQLWKDRDIDPRPVLIDLFSLADIAIANHRDFSLLLDRSYSGDGPDRRRQAAEAAFDAFPNLKLIASTARRAEEADRQFLSARVDMRDGAAQTDEVKITNIVDRIGTGDAFAAGVLYALAEGKSLNDVANTGVALAALKHSISGDACLVTHAQLSAFLSGHMDVQR
jgi:2-dehydro-3-deoxygluconokinase